MKKGISILVVLLFSSFIVLYGKKIRHIIAEKPETKTVRFSVFAGTDYSRFLYKKSKAKVILSIYKFEDNQRVLIWEGDINKGAIKNYPSNSKPLFKEVSVYNVYDRNETLAAYYKVVYDYKGSQLSYDEGISLSPGSGLDTLKIPI